MEANETQGENPNDEEKSQIIIADDDAEIIGEAGR